MPFYNIYGRFYRGHIGYAHSFRIRFFTDNIYVSDKLSAAYTGAFCKNRCRR